MKKLVGNIWGVILSACVILPFASCSDEEHDDSVGIHNSGNLQNDCLKRTLGPNLVGEKIYFAYAMAAGPYGVGRIVSAEVEASIPGAEGTYLQNNSFHTNEEGVDVGVKIGEPSETTGNLTKVNFTVDTCAATLRYYYVIPEEARGKQVSFTFRVKSRAGETAYLTMGPYTISKQDMKKGLTLTKSRCYISIADMAVYDAATAATIPDKIDLVYLWRNNIPNVDFGHSFVAPAANPEYLPDIELPEGVGNDVRLRKEWGMIDSHLTDEPNNGTYIDDVDFETLDFTNMPDYAINMKTQGGMWVETQDGKYRAYIYINSLKTISGGTISMKRYTMY